MKRSVLPAGPGPRRPRAVRGLLFAALVGLAAHALHTTAGLGGSALDPLFNDWVYNGVFFCAAVACVGRGLVGRSERRAWLAIGLGLLSWLIGDIYWTIQLSDLETIPYPSLADAFYVALYPAVYIGVVLLVRSRVARFHASLWLDGTIGALAVAAVGAAVLYPAIHGATEGDPAAIATNLAYPLGDILLLSFVVGALALTGWRPGWSWVLIAAGLASNSIADGTYLYQEATTSYVEGTPIDSLWLLGAVLLSCAAWYSPPRPSALQFEGLRLLMMPACFALAAVALQVYDRLEPLNGLAMTLATATLVAVILRMVVSFRENLRLLHVTREEALTDPLTSLGNRRQLLHDLSLIKLDPNRGEQWLFALFDLDGFKSYNDSFGHSAGDALLARLGHNLATAVRPHGTAYRLGGDEFCVLAPTGRVTAGWVVATGSAALSEQGDAFLIGNSCGIVSLPDEAHDSSSTLMLADKRMYAQKSRRALSAERQTRNVLLRVLREREPRLGEHLAGVAQLAVALGQALDLDAEELDTLARAAELHDVGKMAIPDKILYKAGPLDDAESELMREHTLIGERILAAAPAMAPVAKLVRSSHERWDGQGYPDRLAGEEIPAGARIIAICDAFTAMLEERPWRPTKTEQEALDELRRFAGSQFDPRLVERFCESVYAQSSGVDDPHSVVPLR